MVLKKYLKILGQTNLHTFNLINIWMFTFFKNKNVTINY